MSAKKILSALILIVCSISGVSAARSETHVLKLVQNRNISGSQTVYLSNQAVRIENGSIGMNFFCREPFKEVLFANPKTHRFKSLEMIQAIQLMRGMQLLSTLADPPIDRWSGPQPATLNDLKCSVYTSNKTHGGSWCKLWVLDKKVSNRLVQLICAGTGMPDQFGLPLQMEQFLGRNDMSEVDQAAGTAPKSRLTLESKFAREITVADDFMSCPRDYIRTKGSAEVMSNSSGWANIKEIKDSPEFLFKSSEKQLQGKRAKVTNEQSNMMKGWQDVLREGTKPGAKRHIYQQPSGSNR